MRKFIIALAVLLLIPAFTVKAEEKEKKDENKHQPVKLGIWEWEFAWPLVFRAASTDEAIVCVIPETECE